MKDYYADFLTKNSGNTPVSKVPKVSEPPFDTFDTDYTEPNHNFSPLQTLLENSELKEQFEFGIEERTAIMMFDLDLPEIEAERLARQCVEDTWTGLFLTN